MPRCDVVIIGAGPFGLSAAAHLRARGIGVKVFGQPMSFWDCHMPEGMFLRSPWAASHLSDPKGAYSLDAFRQVAGNHFGSPIPLDCFVAYGRWFQTQGVPEVDVRRVQRVWPQEEGFRLSLEDGEEAQFRRVIVAAGIETFSSRPPQFNELPNSLVSHSVDHKDLGKFRGLQVLVVGAGQSALESAALLHENGAQTEVLMRKTAPRFLHQRPWLHNNPIVSRVLYAPADVGPALLSQLVARPGWCKLLPGGLRHRTDVRSIRPAGAKWLKSRLQDVRIIAGRSISSASRQKDRVQVALDDGSVSEADHVLLATGYRIDISKYGFLPPELLSRIRQVNHYPQLDAGFETSVRGLHFIGATAAWSFGPLMRFVAGADYAARAVTRRIRKLIN